MLNESYEELHKRTVRLLNEALSYNLILPSLHEMLVETLSLSIQEQTQAIHASLARKIIRFEAHGSKNFKLERKIMNLASAGFDSGAVDEDELSEVLDEVLIAEKLGWDEQTEKLRENLKLYRKIIGKRFVKSLEKKNWK